MTKCKNCDIDLVGKDYRAKYCSRSCAAAMNNKLFPKKIRQTPILVCTCDLNTLEYFTQCTKHPERSMQTPSAWLNGAWRGGTDISLSKIIREFLLKKVNYACEKCGFNTVHPDDGRSILEVNHIDGNGLNHSPNNLEVICPNCHALTSSYRGRNVGSGRPVSYLRKTHPRQDSNLHTPITLLTTG